ncbi:hypothetical protein SAMN05216330_104440 [Bradyrhizobium sp. Ghvi]|nr:hypothetical protein SAMN05216330_104440 [Bradyrhizobium sp. Ghvi]
MLHRMLAILIDNRHQCSYPRFARLREPWSVWWIEEGGG